ncbi:hypothetical protein AJ80_03476 [Polytolypa hystricis UAMH7299]|uniref:Uncharacterized protein n=1 Tax=Polytolypa hystricis (strain UAMH7299) TaxID=1447883 RepID=A0A2B7YGQ6_POLH7|nr:hypothetical protein AJ80_03476 [Polytolypa hystricis UAMH7299]
MEYHQIQDAFSGEKNRVRVSYNAKLSTTAVRRAPTRVHARLIGAVMHDLFTQSPTPEGWALVPDLQFLYTMYRSDEGFVEVPILILEESPAYRNPLGLDPNVKHRNNITGKEEDIATVLQRLEEPIKNKDILKQIQLKNPEDSESPLLWRGVRWVGKMEATLGVWIRDQETGQARRKLDPVLFYGNQAGVDPKSPYLDARVEDVDVNLKFSDFVPSDDDVYNKKNDGRLGTLAEWPELHAKEARWGPLSGSNGEVQGERKEKKGAGENEGEGSCRG